MVRAPLLSVTSRWESHPRGRTATATRVPRASMVSLVSCQRLAIAIGLLVASAVVAGPPATSAEAGRLRLWDLQPSARPDWPIILEAELTGSVAAEVAAPSVSCPPTITQRLIVSPNRRRCRLDLSGEESQRAAGPATAPLTVRFEVKQGTRRWRVAAGTSVHQYAGGFLSVGPSPLPPAMRKPLVRRASLFAGSNPTTIERADGVVLQVEWQDTVARGLGHVFLLLARASEPGSPRPVRLGRLVAGRGALTKAFVAHPEREDSILALWWEPLDESGLMDQGVVECRVALECVSATGPSTVEVGFTGVVAPDGTSRLASIAERGPDFAVPLRTQVRGTAPRTLLSSVPVSWPPG